VLVCYLMTLSQLQEVYEWVIGRTEMNRNVWEENGSGLF
jgi:hypothetical protein